MTEQVKTDIKELKAEKKQLKAQLTRFLTFLEKPEIAVMEVELRLQNIVPVYEKFSKVIKQLLILDEDNAECYSNEETMFEDEYFKILTMAKALLDRQGISEDRNSTTSGSQVSGSGGDNNMLQGVRLPTLNLPIFSGEYDQWLLFRDIFKALIDNNDKLTDVQKFQYLRSTLKGDARSIIGVLEMSAENYKTAWGLLMKRYENNKLIINTHLKGIVECAPVPKEDHIELRQFLDNFQTHVQSLKSLNQPIDQCDALLNYLVTKKLDFATRKEWEIEAGRKAHDEMPKFEELMEFLANKCQTLELVNKNRPKQDQVTKLPWKKSDKTVNQIMFDNMDCI